MIILLTFRQFIVLLFIDLFQEETTHLEKCSIKYQQRAFITIKYGPDFATKAYRSLERVVFAAYFFVLECGAERRKS